MRGRGGRGFGRRIDIPGHTTPVDSIDQALYPPRNYPRIPRTGAGSISASKQQSNQIFTAGQLAERNKGLEGCPYGWPTEMVEPAAKAINIRAAELGAPIATRVVVPEATAAMIVSLQSSLPSELTLYHVEKSEEGLTQVVFRDTRLRTRKRPAALKPVRRGGVVTAAQPIAPKSDAPVDKKRAREEGGSDAGDEDASAESESEMSASTVGGADDDDDGMGSADGGGDDDMTF